MITVAQGRSVYLQKYLKVAMRLAAVVICTLFVVGAFDEVALAVDCPHPALTGVSATPTSLIGGNQNFNVTLTFAAAIPNTCFHYYSCSSTNSQAVSAGICPANFTGNGTNQKTLTAISKVVDQTQNVTLTYQAQSAQNTQNPVGSPASTRVTVTPMALRSFTVSTAQLAQGQTATGTILLEGVVRSTLNGSARVNITASPSTAVQIPTSIQITCCVTDGAGHSKGTFSIAARPVALDTQVVISVRRPNQTALTRTITVKR